jgi:hypothetical protein
VTFKPDDRVLNTRTHEYGIIVGRSKYSAKSVRANYWEVRYDGDPGIWDVAESRLELVEQEG